MTSTLDLFLLTLIDEGISTAYALSRAGVSVGAALPALARLTKGGFVRKGKPGVRGRTAYELTVNGRKALTRWREEWQQYLESPPNDVESVFRLAAVAWTNGRRGDALRLLEAAVARRTKAVREETWPSGPERDASMIEIYRWMAAVNAAAVQAAQGRALGKVLHSLRRA